MKTFILSFIAVIIISILLYKAFDYIILKILCHMVNSGDEIEKLDD